MRPVEREVRPMWDSEEVLRKGKAKTRDGRMAFQLKTATSEDGTKIIIGMVSTKKPPFKPGLIDATRMWWTSGGLGNGPDDLV